MMAHDQNTERLIKEISAQKSSNIAVVFHTCRGETCPPYSQWIRRSLQSTLLTPEHGRLLTCAPLHCLRGTGFTPFTDLIFTIFFFFFTHWQTKMMGDVLLTGSLCDRMSPPFFPVRQLFISHSFQLCGGRLGIIEAAAAAMDNNRLTPNWAVQEPQKTSSQPPGSWSYSEKPALGLIMNLGSARAQTRGI